MSEHSSTCSSPAPSISGEDTSTSLNDKDDVIPSIGDKSENSNSSNNSNNTGPSISKSSTTQRPRRGRGGITFLSGDPMKIGLIGKKGSLSTVVRALQQKKLLKKEGTLEKSKQDWQAFKQKEGIEDELKTQIKSKNGYLERQDFLKRTDLREFEIEKDLRAKKRRLNYADD